jgi:hypothetical protein
MQCQIDDGIRDEGRAVHDLFRRSLGRVVCHVAGVAIVMATPRAGHTVNVAVVPVYSRTATRP